MSEQLKQELAADLDRSETGTIANSKTIGEQEKELPEGELENEKGKTEDGVAVKQKAKAKLEVEKEKAKQKNFADPVIAYLLKRCEEDQGLAEDVVQESKTWDKCFNYIVDQARKISRNGNGVAVEDHTVYEWAEDYYHKEEKPEVKKISDKKASGKKQAVSKEENTSSAKKPAKKVDISTKLPKTEEKCLENKENAQENKKTVKKDAANKQRKKEKTDTKSSELSGQMSLFDLL